MYTEEKEQWTMLIIIGDKIKQYRSENKMENKLYADE